MLGTAHENNDKAFDILALHFTLRIVRMTKNALTDCKQHLVGGKRRHCESALSNCNLEKNLSMYRMIITYCSHIGPGNMTELGPARKKIMAISVKKKYRPADSPGRVI